jgi:hydrogenase maturation protease
MTILIIGYGNPLRSDDGVGQRLADLVARQQWHKVRSLCVFQLTPELAEEIAQVKAVIFIDAIASESRQQVIVERLEPLTTGTELGHLGNPRSLLALTQAIYGCLPSAWGVFIPGINFAIGDQLSPATEKFLLDALQEIDKLVMALNDNSV